jgi:hypothetical protein
MDQGLYGIDESDITRIEDDESADRDGDYQFRLGQTESPNGNGVPDTTETDPAGNAE